MKSGHLSSTALLQQPVLVLNADFQPLGMGEKPYSISGEDAVTAQYLERVYVVKESGYYAHSPHQAIPIPHVVALRQYAPQWSLHKRAALSLETLTIRDGATCQYTGKYVRPGHKDANHRATFDHYIPECRGGGKTWENGLLVSARINCQKGSRMPEDFGMRPLSKPWAPTQAELLRLWLTTERLKGLPEAWLEYFNTVPVTKQVRRIMDTYAERRTDLWEWQRRELGLEAA